MRHHDVVAANSLLAFSRTHSHQTFTPHYLAHVAAALEGAEAQFAPVVGHRGGVVGEQSGVHALYRRCGVLQVAADKAVPSLVMHYLEPSHVDLHQCTSAPLPGFQHDKANGSSCRAHRFEAGEHAALRHIEGEGYVARGGLVLYRHALAAPELEVVSRAATGMVGPRHAWRETGISEHSHRYPHFSARLCHTAVHLTRSHYHSRLGRHEQRGALAEAAKSGDRVVGRDKCLIAPTVFGNQFISRVKIVAVGGSRRGAVVRCGSRCLAGMGVFSVFHSKYFFPDKITAACAVNLHQNT